MALWDRADSPPPPGSTLPDAGAADEINDFWRLQVTARRGSEPNIDLAGRLAQQARIEERAIEMVYPAFLCGSWPDRVAGGRTIHPRGESVKCSLNCRYATFIFSPMANSPLRLLDALERAGNDEVHLKRRRPAVVRGTGWIADMSHVFDAAEFGLTDRAMRLEEPTTTGCEILRFLIDAGAPGGAPLSGVVLPVSPATAHLGLSSMVLATAGFQPGGGWEYTPHPSMTLDQFRPTNISAKRLSRNAGCTEGGRRRSGSDEAMAFDVEWERWA
jgi:hypothetical protein